MTRDSLEQFKKRWLGHGYVEVRPGGKAVRNTQTHVRIDFLLTGDFPGDGSPKPIPFPEPKDVLEWIEGVPVIALQRFIELKLASGMTAKDRPRDLDDVIQLIRARGLPLEFGEQLHPYVRSKFSELWEASQLPADDY